MNFKEQSTYVSSHLNTSAKEGWEDGVTWALEQVVNTLWRFGEDEQTKKMKVRQMLTDMRGEIN